MGPAVFVMAILGCGEATDVCEPVATMPVRYESVEACNAATASAIERHSDALYPVVVAECRAAGTNVAKVYADEVKLPAPDASRPRIQRASYQPQRIRS
ncbi:MAG TPA: hypothetical protein VF662_08415 [Allosphingosinicella sp.]